MDIRVGETFWDDPTCIQCRATEYLERDQSELWAEIRTGTVSMALQSREGATLQRVNPDGFDRLIEAGVLVGMRKARIEARSVLLDPHECGKSDA